MNESLRKKLLRFGVLALFLGSAFFVLNQSPQEARITVELDKIHSLSGVPAAQVECKLFQEDGQWISTATTDFPEALYPNGPGPRRLEPMLLKLRNGNYRAEVTVSFRDGAKTPQPFQKTFLIKLDSSNREALLGL